MLRVLSALILAVLVSQPLSAQAPGLATVSVRVAQQEPTTRPITVRSVLAYWGGASRVWDVFMVGFEGNVRLWPHVSLVGSAQRWSRGEVLCPGTGCGPPPFKEGWSIGGGVRVAGEPTARVWWPFAQVEFGAHRYPHPRPRNGKVQPFVAGRVGLAARLGSHWEVEIGTKVQRVSGFEYDNRIGFFDEWMDTHVIVSAKTFAALQLSLGFQLPLGLSD